MPFPDFGWQFLLFLKRLSFALPPSRLSRAQVNLALLSLFRRLALVFLKRLTPLLKRILIFPRLSPIAESQTFSAPRLYYLIGCLLTTFGFKMLPLGGWKETLMAAGRAKSCTLFCCLAQRHKRSAVVINREHRGHTVLKSKKMEKKFHPPTRCVSARCKRVKNFFKK